MPISSTIDFGTSGLRGPADGFTPQTVAAYVRAFLKVAAGGTGSRTVFIGADLRDSSPRIARLAMAAARSVEFEPVFAGVVPTPALAAYALARKAPALMVTGSHIPETYNGMKFYRRDGELLKSDEAPMRSAALEQEELDLAPFDAHLLDVDAAIGEAYVQRYVQAFGANALKGLRIGFDAHSAAGRDLLPRILRELGAECLPYNRASSFVAVDTEALPEELLEASAGMIKEHKLDAVVSTDGDGDRPLVIDEKGSPINGDVLGALAAKALGISNLVTPLNSTSAIERSGWFSQVARTRIGSPYVVAEMAASASRPIAGFEPNGGFLLGDPIEVDGGLLDPLPTRDAVLPMLAVLAEARKANTGLSAQVASLPARFMRADRIKQVPSNQSAALMGRLAHDPKARAAFDPSLEEPQSVDTTDGIRFTRHDGSIIHFRPSGNAPEMRCYVEADNLETTQNLLRHFMVALRGQLQAMENKT